jgi:hypothetical protein
MAPQASTGQNEEYQDQRKTPLASGPRKCEQGVRRRGAVGRIWYGHLSYPSEFLHVPAIFLVMHVVAGASWIVLTQNGLRLRKRWVCSDLILQLSLATINQRAARSDSSQRPSFMKTSVGPGGCYFRSARRV